MKIKNDAKFKSIKVSLRLKAIAEMIDKNSDVVDIGTDHSYLAIYLCIIEKIKKAIVSDIEDKPLITARKNIKKFKLAEKIILQKSDGLKSIELQGLETIIIAGIGIKKIIKVLNESYGKLCLIKNLILQGQGNNEELCEWLWKNNWKIVDENWVLEKNHIYQIIKCRQKL